MGHFAITYTSFFSCKIFIYYARFLLCSHEAPKYLGEMFSPHVRFTDPSNVFACFFLLYLTVRGEEADHPIAAEHIAPHRAAIERKKNKEQS